MPLLEKISEQKGLPNDLRTEVTNWNWHWKTENIKVAWFRSDRTASKVAGVNECDRKSTRSFAERV